MLRTKLPLGLVFFTSQCFSQTGFNVHETSISELPNIMATGEVTAVRLVEQYPARIDAFDNSGPVLNSIIKANPDAIEQSLQHIPAL